MSYDQTKKFDKNPDRFGTGDPEGVCAAESANNATVAPAMIPLLTLSIPGSPTAAVLLGGLLIHGLFPRPPTCSRKRPTSHTRSSAACSLHSSFMCFFGLLASRYSHLVANAPNYMMFAAVMILCVFGSYCVQNSYEDVIPHVHPRSPHVRARQVRVPERAHRARHHPQAHCRGEFPCAAR